jgi:uncharacterized protein DUF3830
MPAKRHIRLTFVETGESVIADVLDDEAPKTSQLVWDLLPLEHTSVHGRYSGMEVFIVVEPPKQAPAENETGLPLPGEILYWSALDTSVTGGGRLVAEVCVIYGRGVTLRGPEGMPSRGSLFARIPGDWKHDWIPFQEACKRIRTKGTSALRIERVERV